MINLQHIKKHVICICFIKGNKECWQPYLLRSNFHSSPASPLCIGSSESGPVKSTHLGWTPQSHHRRSLHPKPLHICWFEPINSLASTQWEIRKVGLIPIHVLRSASIQLQGSMAPGTLLSKLTLLTFYCHMTLAALHKHDFYQHNQARSSPRPTVSL